MKTTSTIKKAAPGYLLDNRCPVCNSNINSNVINRNDVESEWVDKRPEGERPCGCCYSQLTLVEEKTDLGTQLYYKAKRKCHTFKLCNVTEAEARAVASTLCDTHKCINVKVWYSESIDCHVVVTNTKSVESHANDVANGIRIARRLYEIKTTPEAKPATATPGAEKKNPNARLTIEEAAKKYTGMMVHLDGKPAKVIGRLNPVATIAPLDTSKGSVEFSWLTVSNVIENHWGYFKS